MSLVPVPLRIFIVVLLAVGSGCNTTMEVTVRQWENCVKLCGGRLAKAGMDWMSTEKTCLCENRVRFRYEGQQTNTDEDGLE